MTTQLTYYVTSVYLDAEDEIDTATVTAVKGVASDELKSSFRYFVDLLICSILSYLGLVDNVITIFVFAKMGFKETINISMTAIACCDVIKCLSCVIIRVYGIMELVSPYDAMVGNMTTTLYLGYLHGIAGYVSGAMAGYVSVERCLCVTFPFTVKTLLSRKVVITINIALTIIVSASFTVVYGMWHVMMVYNFQLNRTFPLLGPTKLVLNNPWLNDYQLVLSMLWPMLCFLIICICTGVIARYLRKSSKLRSTTSSLKNKDPGGFSARDRQVMKMLLVVIIVYIVSYIPRLCNYFTFILVPEYRAYAGYANIMWIITYIMFVFDLTNSALNPFIFFFMSSQFRLTFLKMFGMSKKN